MQQSFSTQLERWLKGKGPKTLAALEDVFAEKSIAIGIMLLLFLSALPIPTGGITNIMEIVAMILALELVAGRRTVWLPKSWRQRNLGELAEKKVLPMVIKYIRWFERFSRSRWSGFMRQREALRLIGLLTLIFILGSFVAPPFSGLDTLPSLAVVVVMLAVILEDSLLFVVGCVIGAAGIGLIIGLSTAITQGLQRLF